MQHDVFVHPSRHLRRAYPFVVVLQSDYAEGRLRLTAPLLPALGAPAAPSRALLRVDVEGRPFRLYLAGMASVDVRQLRTATASLACYRDDITRALDWLFTGI